MNPAIKASRLTKSYGEIRAVKGVDLEVERGELFAFLGPNGAGKTTTQRMLTGVIKPDGGSIEIMGCDLLKNPFPAKMFLGIVPETSNVYIDLTAWDNLMLMGKLYNVSRKERRKRGEELLKRLGIFDRRNEPTKGFSRGMKRRLLLATALISGPDLLFLDEPTSGLDVSSAKTMRQLIKDLNKEGVTVFLTTHNLEEANELCSKAAIIKEGEIIAVDDPEKLKSTISTSQFVEVVFERKVKGIPEIAQSGRVNRVVEKGKGFKVYTAEPGIMAGEIVDYSRKKGLAIADIKTSGPSLEDVFLHLTEPAGSV